MDTSRDIVAEFQKMSDGRIVLWSLTVIKYEVNRDGREYDYKMTYDVNYSRQYGYLFHHSGSGGAQPITVDGIYFATEGVRIKEKTCRLVYWKDKTGRRTHAIRKRNRTRRLLILPKQFDLESGEDLLTWLQHNAIEQEAVWCSECRDNIPGDILCDHCWWCDAIGWYSTPDERCKCKNREECYG